MLLYGKLLSFGRVVAWLIQTASIPHPLAIGDSNHSVRRQSKTFSAAQPHG